MFPAKHIFIMYGKHSPHKNADMQVQKLISEIYTLNEFQITLFVNNYEI